jgi:hypothetical protein
MPQSQHLGVGTFGVLRKNLNRFKVVHWKMGIDEPIVPPLPPPPSGGLARGTRIGATVLGWWAVLQIVELHAS